MATITGLTAERMQEIVDATIVGAHISGDDLVLELYDTTEINAGDVRGPVGPQGPNADVGDIKSSIKTSIAGWLLMGQSIAGADVAYPALWAEVPASWKSGTTLNLPVMGDTVLQSAGAGGALGAVTGGNTKTLVAANLPPHSHTQPDHTHVGAAHVHSMTHDHAMEDQSVLKNIGQGAYWLNTSAGTLSHPERVSYIGSGVQTSAFSGNTGGASATTTGADGGDPTGNGPGTSSAFNVEQRALRVNFFIKY